MLRISLALAIPAALLAFLAASASAAIEPFPIVDNVVNPEGTPSGQCPMAAVQEGREADGFSLIPIASLVELYPELRENAVAADRNGDSWLCIIAKFDIRPPYVDDIHGGGPLQPTYECPDFYHPILTIGGLNPELQVYDLNGDFVVCKKIGTV